MNEIATWDLDRLYSKGDILVPILELKEQYFCNKRYRYSFKTYTSY